MSAAVTRLTDAAAVAEASATRFAESVHAAVQRNDRAVVVLAGGSTPRLLYRRLSAPPHSDSLPWPKVVFLFGDERCVGPDDEQSNYRMARETLFGPLRISDRQILRMEGERPPPEAAARYQLRLRDLFAGELLPRFDLLLLGVGADGHTASLFPGTAALDERRRWVAANRVPQLDAWRLTLTLPALRAARRILFLVTGERKAEVVAEAFGGRAHESFHPCEHVVPEEGSLEVLVDADAGRLLEP